MAGSRRALTLRQMVEECPAPPLLPLRSPASPATRPLLRRARHGRLLRLRPVALPRTRRQVAAGRALGDRRGDGASASSSRPEIERLALTRLQYSASELGGGSVRGRTLIPSSFARYATRASRYSSRSGGIGSGSRRRGRYFRLCRAIWRCHSFQYSFSRRSNSGSNGGGSGCSSRPSVIAPNDNAGPCRDSPQSEWRRCDHWAIDAVLEQRMARATRGR
jgi:hypothetical protein